MKTKITILLTMFVLLSIYNVFAVPNLKLPFQGGEKWRCDQGNNGGYSHTGKLKYAWDFNFGSGNDDLGKSVVAPASGTIIYAQNTAWGWGNVVIIDYGDGSYGNVSPCAYIEYDVGNILELELREIVEDCRNKLKNFCKERCIAEQINIT